MKPVAASRPFRRGESGQHSSHTPPAMPAAHVGVGVFHSMTRDGTRLRGRGSAGVRANLLRGFSAVRLRHGAPGYCRSLKGALTPTLTLRRSSSTLQPSLRVVPRPCRPPLKGAHGCTGMFPGLRHPVRHAPPRPSCHPGLHAIPSRGFTPPLPPAKPPPTRRPVRRYQLPSARPRPLSSTMRGRSPLPIPSAPLPPFRTRRVMGAPSTEGRATGPTAGFSSRRTTAADTEKVSKAEGGISDEGTAIDGQRERGACSRHRCKGRNPGGKERWIRERRDSH